MDLYINLDPTKLSFSSAFAQFSSWITSASATNMKNMLSAQLAAMELNVNYGGQNGLQYIDVSLMVGSSYNTLGSSLLLTLASVPNINLSQTYFISINDLMAAADAAIIGTIPTTRAQQEALKDVLDAADNGFAFFVL